VTASSRALATVLFTDIVGSTERATELGDREWRKLLDEHNNRVRRELRHFGGRELNTAGDGFLAVFQAPAMSVACADAIQSTQAHLGVVGDRMRDPQARGEDVIGRCLPDFRIPAQRSR
jgi:class 3 adenylate cyclase